MQMFEIFKFEFVVWLDLNSIDKIKRKGNRNFRIKEKAKTTQDALSLGLFGPVSPARVAEPPELFQLKCLSLTLKARPHLNRNKTSVPRI
jgi:hypothetical protein